MSEPAHGSRGGGILRLVGSGIVAGAADHEPSAVGTCAGVGARHALAFRWVAPVVPPMTQVVVSLPARLGRIDGKGLCPR